MNERVAITGARGGIGSVLADGFSGTGCAVVAMDLPFDATRDDLVGDVDVLVNCAAVTRADWDTTLAVNLTGTKRMCEQAHALGARSIINITSLGAHLAFPDNVAYEVSKAGVLALTRALAKAYAPACRVNAICPGYIHTPMTDASWRDPVERERRAARTMLGRWGKPADLVGAVLFLASDASAYVTGTELVVDGGWLANGL